MPCAAKALSFLLACGDATPRHSLCWPFGHLTATEGTDATRGMKVPFGGWNSSAGVRLHRLLLFFKR
jgi:hypothetical protein